jgi:very-short-patch-repair endonuclease
MVTNSLRTLTDLRRVLPRNDWEDAIDRARSLHLPIPDLGAEAPTRSRLERRMLALCRRHHLPKPETNVRVGPFLVDFLWRDQRLIAETDSFEHHGDRAAFEADRARDARLKLMGYTVVRFTWRQMVDQPERVAATIRGLLRIHEVDAGE